MSIERREMSTVSKNDYGTSGFSGILRALNYRNYRLFFLGQGISLIGTWMQNIAISWLVFRLTNSPMLMGLVSFAVQLPTLLVAPFAGVLIDRWNRHTIVKVTQFLAMLQAFMLAYLTLTGVVKVWHIIALGIFIGIVTAFDMPGRQAFLANMIEKKEDLGNAIALNSSMFNGARLIGPTIAGIIIAKLGEGECFLLNGISFLAVLIALMMMRINAYGNGGRGKHILIELKEGLSYAFGFPPVRSILSLLFLVSMMGMPAMVLMPIFCSQILHGGPELLGFLMAASGVGALAGALFLAARKNVLGLGRIIVIASSIFGIGLMAFSFSRNVYLSLVFILITGFGMMVQMASSNTLIQTIVEEDKRGRVMSIYTTSFMGAAPMGSLMAGWLAHAIGAPATVGIGGFFVIVGSILFASRLPSIRILLRPIYEAKGILPGNEPGVPFKSSARGSHRE